MSEDIFNEADELMDEVMNDPGIQRETQREREEWERQRLDIQLRPQSSPGAPTDGELLNLIGKGFDLFCEVPFGRDIFANSSKIIPMMAMCLLWSLRKPSPGGTN